MNHYDAYHLIIRMLFEKGEFHETVSWVNQWMEISPNNLHAYEFRAIVFKELARIAEPPRDIYYRSRALQDEEMVLRLGNR